MEASTDQTHIRESAPPYETLPTPPAHAPRSPYSQKEMANVMDLDTVMSQQASSPQAINTPSPMDIAAAHVLDGLRAGDSKDRSRHTTTHVSPIDPALLAHEEGKQPEPLLSLLTSQHPIIFTALNGPLQVYSSSKNYSPRFRQSAEFVENTVNTAGRLSGVETGVRWWLQRNDSLENTAEDRGNKRRRMNDDQAQVEKGLRDVSLSIRSRALSEVSAADSLPPYDGDQRSPKYEETPTTEASGSNRQVTHSGNSSARTWQTRLMLSTSGLGVAMSQDSRNRLTYCLKMLRVANNRIADLLQRLNDLLSEWDRSQHSADSHAHPDRASSAPSNQAAIMQQVQGLKTNVIKTLQDTINIVSQYAGGTLPENARVLVTRHLTSLPKRFYLASSAQANASSSSSDAEKTGGSSSSSTAQNGTPSSPEHITAAQRVMVLAREGLDMLGQVSGILDGTLESAEAWCNRLGMKQQDQDQERRVEEGGEEEKGGRDVNGHAEGHQTGNGSNDAVQGPE